MMPTGVGVLCNWGGGHRSQIELRPTATSKNSFWARETQGQDQKENWLTPMQYTSLVGGWGVGTYRCGETVAWIRHKLDTHWIHTMQLAIFWNRWSKHRDLWRQEPCQDLGLRGLTPPIHHQVLECGQKTITKGPSIYISMIPRRLCTRRASIRIVLGCGHPWSGNLHRTPNSLSSWR